MSHIDCTGYEILVVISRFALLLLVRREVFSQYLKRETNASRADDPLDFVPAFQSLGMPGMFARCCLALIRHHHYIIPSHFR